MAKYGIEKEVTEHIKGFMGLENTPPENGNVRFFYAWYRADQYGSYFSKNFNNIKFYRATSTYSDSGESYTTWILVCDSVLVSFGCPIRVYRAGYGYEETFTGLYGNNSYCIVVKGASAKTAFAISPTIVNEGDNIELLRNIRDIQEYDLRCPFKDMFVAQIIN